MQGPTLQISVGPFENFLQSSGNRNLETMTHKVYDRTIVYFSYVVVWIKFMQVLPCMFNSGCVLRPLGLG